MITCSPQRYLANNRNVLLAATLEPSTVEPVSNSVLAIPLPRDGTAQASIEGSYSGAEEATYEVEILDDDVETNLISKPIFSGAGSGNLANIASELPAQSFVVELADNGIPELTASVDFDGVTIKARAPGADGNLIRIEIDQSPLVFTETNFSLLKALSAGAGGVSSGLEGPAYDFDTAVKGADDQIPVDAHRIAFADDHSQIYLQYKAYADSKWKYYFVPELKRDVPAGTRIEFVTGGRTVTISDGGSPVEEFEDIVTLYDLLDKIKTDSALVDVDGVVANDRSPTGQASQELASRTDAHVEPSTGSGSDAATGFINTSAAPGASTELITAKCFAVNAADYPLASLANSYWTLKGSVSGDLGFIVEGVPFSNANFGLTIERKLPSGFGVQKGRFTHTSTSYVTRVDPEIEPPICMKRLTLGIAASDQTITLTYTARPSGNCACDNVPAPALKASCLGLNFLEGDVSDAYQVDTQEKLVELYDFEADTIRNNSSYIGGFAFQETFTGIPSEAENDGFAAEDFRTIVKAFEQALALIDPLSTSGSPNYRDAGQAAWDIAFAEFKADVAAIENGGATASPSTFTGTAFETLTAGDAVVRYWDDVSATYKIRKAVLMGGGVYGFVTAGFSAAATATMHTLGTVSGLSGLTLGALYHPTAATPGAWTTSAVAGVFLQSPAAYAISTTELFIVNSTPGSAGTTAVGPGAILSERYRTRLDWVLISANISPLGGDDASILTSGDGCWRDLTDEGFFWEVEGENGLYAPAFNNTAYHSSRKATTDGKYYTTKEFGFVVSVKCPSDLKVGDQITLVIGGAAWGSTYQVGDELVLPIVAAQPLFLAGGQDGNLIQVWYVSGSLVGPLANFVYDPDAPSTYSAGGSPPDLEFELVEGGIPFAKGDRFDFTIEGGHYRWRKNGGSWSSTLVISDAAVALDSGLTLAFTPGASPSFVAGDVFSFLARQPWAVSNLKTPTAARWQWTGAAPTLAVDLGSTQDMDMVSIALHTLPVGTTLTLQGGSTTAVSDWTETLTWREGVISQLFSQQRSSRYIKLTLANATGGGIGWLWVGLAFGTELSAEIDIRDSYRINRADAGLYQGGNYIGKGTGGNIAWTEAAMNEADVVGIKALIDWIKTHDDEPFVLVPNVTRPEAFMVRAGLDDITYEEISKYNRLAEFERRYNISLPLSGVLQ